MNIIKEHFPINDVTVLASPFFGGGSFEFHFSNEYDVTVLANDLFTPLYHFWTSAKYQQEQLCDVLRNSLGDVTKDMFKTLRRDISSLTVDQQAIAFFIINRCSFSGATFSGGFSDESSKKRFTASSINRISNLNLERFSFTSLDFTDFLKGIPPNTLIFLDPPYYLLENSKLYGTNGDLHGNFDHEMLFKCISQLECWIMTYNDCEYIRQLYSGYRILTPQWSYSMNKSKKSCEIVILSR
jgi:DNA adenine methylase